MVIARMARSRWLMPGAGRCSTPVTTSAQTVTVGTVGQASANLWPVFIGLDKGFFAAADLKVDVVYVQSSAQLVQQITAGSLNICMSTGLVDPPGPSWLGNPNLAMGSLIVVNVWRGLPFYAITLLAGLQTISPELYEAATIDGAGTWTKFRYVTLPLMKPGIFIVTMFSVIFTFADFQLIYVLTHGGPANATQVFATYAFDVAMNGGQFGQGALGGRHQLAAPGAEVVQGVLRGGPVGLHRLGGARVGELALGQRGQEEPGVVAARLALRGDPVRPGPQQVGAQHEVRVGEELGQRSLAGFQLSAGFGVRARLVDDAARLGTGEQHAGLLEGLAHRGAHQRARRFRRAAELLRPPGGFGTGPADRGVRVAGVHASAGEDGHTTGEGHPPDPALQEHLEAAVPVAQQHHGRRVPRHGGRFRRFLRNEPGRQHPPTLRHHADHPKPPIDAPGVVGPVENRSGSVLGNRREAAGAARHGGADGVLADRVGRLVLPVRELLVQLAQQVALAIGELLVDRGGDLHHHPGLFGRLFGNGFPGLLGFVSGQFWFDRFCGGRWFVLARWLGGVLAQKLVLRLGHSVLHPLRPGRVQHRGNRCWRRFVALPPLGDVLLRHGDRRSAPLRRRYL